MNPVEKQLKESEQKIRILFEITRFVSSFLYLQDVLDAIVDLLVKEFRLDACSIRLLDSDGNLRIRSHKGLSKAFIEQATRKPTEDCYSGECFLTGRILIVNNADDVGKPISTNRVVGENIKSFALAPIRVEGEIIGVLVTSSKKRNYFHERFNDVIYIIANQIGMAIRMSQLYEEVYTLNQELEKKVQERTAQLEQRTQQLIEAEKLAALGKMSQRVAHELRNSLTVVGGFARRLRERIRQDDPNSEYLEIIVDEVRKLEHKVSKIIKLEALDGIRGNLQVNRPKPKGRVLKKDIKTILSSESLDVAVQKIMSMPLRAVINPLFGLLLSTDSKTKWKAVAVMGQVVTKLADEDMESARVIIRRLMWQLNDESGGIGWGCPEAMGEILARNRKLAEEFAPIVVSYVREDGNFLEYEALQPGAIWAVGRLAQAWPDLVKGAEIYILPFLSSRAPQTRGVAIWALGYLGNGDLDTALWPFVKDESELEIYRDGKVSRVTVGQLAKEALSRFYREQGPP